MQSNTELYEQDFFEWTHTTAALIRAGQWHTSILKGWLRNSRAWGNRTNGRWKVSCSGIISRSGGPQAGGAPLGNSDGHSLVSCVPHPVSDPTCSPYSP
jgi:hypothetical protein